MRRLLLLSLSASLHGCVVSSGNEFADNAAPIGRLAAVAGCYQNAGDAPDSGPVRYLSQLFWPDAQLTHAAISMIDVQVPAADTVRVRAKNSEAGMLDSEYRQGEDFTFDGEQITLPGDWAGSLAAPADNPFIGVAHSSVVLRLDRSGNGVMTESTSIAGTAFLIIPVAGSVKDSVRFTRLSDTCNWPADD